MKPAGRIAFLLGAAVMIPSLSVWLRYSAPAPRNVATTPSLASPTNILANTSLATTATSGPAKVAPDPVPESVRPIVTKVAAIPIAERIKRVRTLPANLAAPEVGALQGYLLASAHSGAVSRPNENWLRNEIMDKLAGQSTLPAGFPRVLPTIYQDPAQDIVMRDYAVQHITPVYPRASAEEKITLQQTLWSAVAETDSSIAGTALLALYDLAQDHREFDPGQLGEAALKLAGDDRCGDLSRITALQICGRMGIDQAAPLVLQLAQNAGSVPLRISAIAALGEVGDEAARNYLRQLASQSEPRLRPALETALKKMNDRLGI